MRTLHAPLFSLIPLTLAAAACAQEKPRPPFVFEAGEVAVYDLVDRCAAYLQRNILLAERELQVAVQQVGPRGRPPVRPGAKPGVVEAIDPNTVTFALQQPVVTDRDGCEEMLTGLLWTVGLALVPIDEKKGVYEVIAMSGARQREISARAVIRTAEQVLARPALRMFVTCVVPLEHTNATIATNALRPFFATSQQPQLTIGNMGNSSAVLLTGPQDQVALAVQLLQAADLPARGGTEPEIAMQMQALGERIAEALRRIGELEKKAEKR